MAGDLAHVGHFLGDACLGRRPDAVHQVHRLGRGLGHRVLHPPVGVMGKAQQLRALGPQLHDLGDGRVGVVGVAVVATADELAPDLLAQTAIIGEGQEGIDAGAGVDDHPALDPAGPCSGSRRRPVGRGHAGRTGFAGDHGPGLFVADDLLAKACEDVGQGGVDAAQFGLAGGVERRAVAHEAVAAAGRHAGLLGGQAGSGGTVSDRLDALEQGFVEGDLVTGGRQQRRHLGVHGIVVVRADILGHHAEQRQGAVQRLAGHLHRHQGIGEGRGLGIVRDRQDLGALQVDALQDGLAQLGGAHLVPGWHAAVGAGPLLQQFCLRGLARQDRAGDSGVPGQGGGGNSAPDQTACRGAAGDGQEACAPGKDMASMHDRSVVRKCHGDPSWAHSR